MASEGISSFLLDCHTNDNMAEIEAAYGIKGFAIIVRLWQKIYSDKGYYCEWKERSPLLFLSQWFGGNSGVDLNLINQVVARAINIGIFSNEMYSKYQILTSDRIQNHYFNVVKRRTSIVAKKDYLLISVDNLKGNVNINQENVYRNEKNVYRNPTSKVNKSKVKESKDINAQVTSFEEFWKAYPSDKAKAMTEQAYCKLIQSGVDESELVCAAKNYANSVKTLKTKPQYISHGCNFLAKGTYIDYLKENYQAPNKTFDNQRTYDCNDLEKQLLANRDRKMRKIKESEDIK